MTKDELMAECLRLKLEIIHLKRLLRTLNPEIKNWGYMDDFDDIETPGPRPLKKEKHCEISGVKLD